MANGFSPFEDAEIPAEESCPVYGCTLAPDEHEPVDPEGSFAAEANSLWHSDELAGAHWPAPLEPAIPDPQSFAPAPPYGPYEERYQREERARRMSWVRPSWLSSVADLELQAHKLHDPVAFSGDLRPRLSPEQREALRES